MQSAKCVFIAVFGLFLSLIFCSTPEQIDVITANININLLFLDVFMVLGNYVEPK